MTAPVSTSLCPTCGAPITREDLSLCSYCGSPLQLGGAKETAEGEASPNIERLNRMKEKDEWADAMAWDPLSTSRYPGTQAVVIPLLCGSLAAILSYVIFDYVAAIVLGSIAGISLLVGGIGRVLSQRHVLDAAAIEHRGAFEPEILELEIVLGQRLGDARHGTIGM